MISENVLIHRVREPLGDDCIEVVAMQVENSSAGYTIKFVNAKNLDMFLRRTQINLINVKQKSFVDRKTGKAFIRFKFINDETYPYTPAIRLKFNAEYDEVLASNIYTQLMAQALSASSNVKRGLEHGILSKE